MSTFNSFAFFRHFSLRFSNVIDPYCDCSRSPNRLRLGPLIIIILLLIMILYTMKKIKIPLSKVAIELNKEIVNKKNINKIKLNNKDVVEIVHFIGGG